MRRRAALRWLGAGAAFALGACGGGGGSAVSAAAISADAASATTATDSGTITATGTTAPSSGSAATTCSAIPGETAGPYPADGTNSAGSGIANVLTRVGIVRSNIVSSFGGSSGIAAGIPLTITLNVVNAAKGCVSLAGYAVYLWHCDALGRYSLYSQGVTGEDYLRGVQVTDSSGSVTFTSIFPGCYDGRWPHIHFEVYSSLQNATTGANDVKTSQLAMPAAACNAAYASALYTGSAANLARTSLLSDNVFSDGATLQIPTVTGSNAAGYAIALEVGVSA